MQMEETEPIDYARMKNPPPWYESSQRKVAAIPPSEPRYRPRRRPQLTRFTQLGPSYPDVYCVSDSSILLRKTGDIYELLGSFAPHLKELFRPPSHQEMVLLQETAQMCGFTFIQSEEKK